MCCFIFPFLSLGVLVLNKEDSTEAGVDLSCDNIFITSSLKAQKGEQCFIMGHYVLTGHTFFFWQET